MTTKELQTPLEAQRTATLEYVGSPVVIHSGLAPVARPQELPFDITIAGPLHPNLRRESVTLGVTATEILVAFRGTLPPDFFDDGLSGMDWLNGAEAKLIAVQDRPYRVHKGFWYALFPHLWNQVRTEISALRAAHPGLPVCFTGHSKGGALAQLAAVAFQGRQRQIPTLLCIFASARAGDAALAQAVTEAVDEARRYEYGADIVPHFPPRTGEVARLLGMPLPDVELAGDYSSAGDLYYLPTLPSLDGERVRAPLAGEAPILDPQAADALAAAAIQESATGQTFTINFRDVWVSRSHSIAPETGYDRWIYG